jgi:hypothetical protein
MAAGAVAGMFSPTAGGAIIRLARIGPSESVPHIPVIAPGEPILRMAKWVEKDAKLRALFSGGNPNVDWVKAPNQAPEGGPIASTARHHGDFDDDRPTVLATLARILGQPAVAAALPAERSAPARPAPDIGRGGLRIAVNRSQ